MAAARAYLAVSTVLCMASETAVLLFKPLPRSAALCIDHGMEASLFFLLPVLQPRGHLNLMLFVEQQGMAPLCIACRDHLQSYCSCNL